VKQKDAVIVGARCAGSTLALRLAQNGWDVALVDRDTFPSETVSTHFLFPNSLARFEQLGVLDTLREAHEVPFLDFRIIGFGHEIAGSFTPIEGFEQAAGPRRSALDKAILDTALAAGVEGRFGERVVELIGEGTEEDPAAGVILGNGERINAKWVFGADGRSSTVAGQLGLSKERPMSGENSFLFAYWSGIPNNGIATIEIGVEDGANGWAVEDGLHLLLAAGDPEFTRGSKAERQGRYLELLHRYPATIQPDVLERAEMVSELIVAPESLMRGFFRSPAGPGWALVGDASHFKHPGTAQGISDAVEGAIYVADALNAADPGLDGYEEWREERAREHYEWSFNWGSFPRPELEPVFRGWMNDVDAGQDLRDSFTRQVEPSRVMSPERLARWFGT
jgi:2-polyprenyl-6-methoxyphenol hydroxylase-like FAD-dependent oxidoreductase